MNLALGTRMSDPFTMFKVFRRDALFGIDFVCNRFDFDNELVVKWYAKATFQSSCRELRFALVAEGKKVSFLRDSTHGFGRSFGRALRRSAAGRVMRQHKFSVRRPREGAYRTVLSLL